MTHQEIVNIFRRTFNGAVNPMTPRVIEYGEAGDYLYEISEGDSIFTQAMHYGVTVLHSNGDKSALSTSFDRLDVAQEFAESLGY